MKPYPSYKDSGVEWMGNIPSHWVKTKLIYNLNKLTDGEHISPKFTGKGIPFISSKDLGETGVNLDVNKFVSIEDSIKMRKRCNPEQGDVLIVGRGQIGKISIVDSDNPFCMLGSVILLKVKNDVSNKFVFYFLKSEKVLNELLTTSGFSVLPMISLEGLRKLIFILPTIPEQKQIVSFLDDITQKIDELIEKTEKKIELLKEKRTSLINHCVTKGLNPNVEMKDSGVEWIGEIPSHWDFIPLKHICYMKGRIGWKGLKQDEFLDDGDYYLITGHDIENDQIDWNKCYHISKERYEESPEIMLKEQDLLFTKDGTIGKTLFIHTLPKPTSLNSHLLVTRPTNNRYTSKFLQYIFKSVPFLMYVDHNKTGTTFYGVSQNTMENFRGIFPPLNEQTQIVEYLDKQTQKIDTTIEKETQRIELLREYRQSLISEVVTGKIDVRDEVVV